MKINKEMNVYYYMKIFIAIILWNPVDLIEVGATGRLYTRSEAVSIEGGDRTELGRNGLYVTQLRKGGGVPETALKLRRCH